jgi:phytoene synthase
MSPELAASYDHCAGVAAREAKNFYPSFLLLPAPLRRSMCALYAFMRQTDDIADERGDAAEKHAALAAWKTALDRVLEGQTAPPHWPGWPALADVVARHGLPARLLHEVIEGVSLDVEPGEFATYDDLQGYCYKVASAVGLCCLHIWGYDPDGGRAERLADSCGQALQLTNIIRDVGEDARGGRVYLPREDRERFGVADADLRAARVSPSLRSLLEFEATRAYDHYERVRELEALVDPAGRPMLRAIVGAYRALLDELVGRRFEVLSGRVSVPSWRKALIVLRAYAGRWPAGQARGPTHARTVTRP